MSDFDGSQVIETERHVFFWQPPAPFGQWTPSRFTIEGVDYSCAEQWMMAQKACLFGDAEALQKILATQDPRQHKALGRQVRGFVGALWERARFEVVVAGNRAKFGQDEALKETLLATGDKVLVEASPYDRIWGIGLRADDPRVHDPERWRGQNLLGQALMQVREELRG